MSPTAPKKRSKAKSAPKRAQAAMSREARATYAAIQKVVKHLEQSIGEIQRGLGKAERKIQADARGHMGMYGDCEAPARTSGPQRRAPCHCYF
jgi:hypothetical protein